MGIHPHEPSPELTAQVLEFFARGIPFNKFLGLEVTALERGFARARLPFRDDFVGDPFRPALHGGLVATLLDTTGGAALWSGLSLHDRVSTIDLRVDYLLPARLAELVAEGRVRRAGGRVGVVSIVAFHPDAPDVHIAEAMGVYNIRRASP